MRANYQLLYFHSSDITWEFKIIIYTPLNWYAVIKWLQSDEHLQGGTIKIFLLFLVLYNNYVSLQPQLSLQYPVMHAYLLCGFSIA